MTINKQIAGFKFGKYRLEVLKTVGEVRYNGRTYRLVKVKTHDGLIYWSLRLYNSKGKFIKQLLFEPEIREKITNLLSLPEWSKTPKDETKRGVREIEDAVDWNIEHDVEEECYPLEEK